MKFTSTMSGLMALAGSALAQDYTTTGPFALKIVSSNATINGSYLASYHAGAAIEVLGVVGPDADLTSVSFQFYHNTTEYSPTEGIIFWNLPYNGNDGPAVEEEALRFDYLAFTNVVTPTFFPGGDVYQTIGFDADNKAYISSYYDDSTFVAGQYPDTTVTTKLYNWYACWTYFSGYYYFALNWVTTGTPHNPTCQAVELVRELIAA